MSWLRIELDHDRTAFAPGEEVSGTVSWALEDPPAERVEVRLAWFTRGKGDRDTGVAAWIELPGPLPSDRRDFRLTLPEGPYSFSGKLISLIWAVEVVADPGERAERVEIVVSPTRREVLLHPDLPAGETP